MDYDQYLTDVLDYSARPQGRPRSNLSKTERNHLSYLRRRDKLKQKQIEKMNEKYPFVPDGYLEEYLAHKQFYNMLLSMRHKINFDLVFHIMNYEEEPEELLFE